ncbi:hypothetical protein EIP91_004202 [Steccherinum ochraceum]|uniref:Uncharacterized protein n=1 Tax=Steccherinum ochraceum TaxID=92696 RepID=A0A4R0R9A0_9APHY|nr:hypothetical protein EIP91_004202 [Steccherinum ochraceum]
MSTGSRFPSLPGRGHSYPLAERPTLRSPPTAPPPSRPKAILVTLIPLLRDTMSQNALQRILLQSVYLEDVSEIYDVLEMHRTKYGGWDEAVGSMQIIIRAVWEAVNHAAQRAVVIKRQYPNEVVDIFIFISGDGCATKAGAFKFKYQKEHLEWAFILGLLERTGINLIALGGNKSLFSKLKGPQVAYAQIGQASRIHRYVIGNKSHILSDPDVSALFKSYEAKAARARQFRTTQPPARATVPRSMTAAIGPFAAASSSSLPIAPSQVNATGTMPTMALPRNPMADVYNQPSYATHASMAHSYTHDVSQAPANQSFPLQEYQCPPLNPQDILNGHAASVSSSEYLSFQDTAPLDAVNSASPSHDTPSQDTGLPPGDFLIGQGVGTDLESLPSTSTYQQVANNFAQYDDGTYDVAPATTYDNQNSGQWYHGAPGGGSYQSVDTDAFTATSAPVNVSGPPLNPPPGYLPTHYSAPFVNAPQDHVPINPAQYQHALQQYAYLNSPQNQHALQQYAYANSNFTYAPNGPQQDPTFAYPAPESQQANAYPWPNEWSGPMQ